jgi:nucleoside-diphosphate-sugar epimerase
MSEKYVIVGAGPVGSATARLLVADGHQVIVVTRSGRRPDLPGVERVALDASDAAALTRLTQGAVALFNCANPPDYTKWARWWPPLAESLLITAEGTGALLVTASSLYGYGPTDTPMVEGQPDLATDKKGRIRAGMWGEARARHEAGRLRAVEVRASDYVGAGVGGNGHITRHVPTATRGRAAWVMGSPDLPHTWTDVLDVARTLVALAGRPELAGRIWHAPSNPPKTQREALTDVLAALGKPSVRMISIPRPVLVVADRFVQLLRELDEVAYMFRRPYVMDSTETQQHVGFAPTPWYEVCRRTATGNERGSD